MHNFFHRQAGGIPIIQSRHSVSSSRCQCAPARTAPDDLITASPDRVLAVEPRDQWTVFHLKGRQISLTAVGRGKYRVGGAGKYYRTPKTVSVTENAQHLYLTSEQGQDNACAPGQITIKTTGGRTSK